MSISVELKGLREAIAETDRAPYLLTVADDGRPHSVAVSLSWRDGELLAPVGNRTLTNARERGLVSLLWPPKEPTGYSLIVDANVTAVSGTGSGDNTISLRPTKAVLHRPAGDQSPTTDASCAADCIPLSGN